MYTFHSFNQNISQKLSRETLFLNTLIFSTLQNVEQITAELPFDGASGIHGALTLSLSTLPTKESQTVKLNNHCSRWGKMSYTTAEGGEYQRKAKGALNVPLPCAKGVSDILSRQPVQVLSLSLLYTNLYKRRIRVLERFSHSKWHSLIGTQAGSTHRTCSLNNYRTFMQLYARVLNCSVVSDSATPWTVTRQALLSMGYPRQEYQSGLPFPSPGDLPNPGMQPESPAGQGDSLPLSHQESSL